MRRLLIYFIYDQQGIVDDYIFYALQKLHPHMDRITVVSNGKLCEKAKQELSCVADQILERENVGFDVWAYKTALDSYGWSTLEQYDEIILMNYTIMGPVYDLADMFETMDSKPELDFWGITKCFREDNPDAVKLWGNPYGYIPEHIQSSFTSFRKRLVQSEIFQKLWDEMPMIQSYYESGGTYEQVITKKLADAGFLWDCYTDYSSLDPQSVGCCPLITDPMTVVGKLKSPFFKRRSFFTSKREYPALHPFAKMFWHYLKTDTSYDTNMVLRNLIRTVNQRDIVESLLQIHLSEEIDTVSVQQQGNYPKIAVFASLENILDTERFYKALDNLKPFCDVFTGSGMSPDIYSLGTGAKASFMDYDYVVWVFAPEQGRNEDQRIYRNRQEYYIYSMLENSNLILSSVKVLESNPLIGMLSLPVDYLRSMNWEEYESWADYFKLMEKWQKTNEMCVPIDMDKPPISSLGGCAILRTKAIAGIEKKHHRIFTQDFISYTLALICQHNGFIPQYIIAGPLLKNALFGYCGYTSMMPDVLKVKKEYYAQLAEYNRQTAEYNLNTISHYRKQMEYYQGLSERLQAENQQLKAQLDVDTKNKGNSLYKRFVHHFQTDK